MIRFVFLLDDAFCFLGLAGEWEIGAWRRACFNEGQGSEGPERDATWHCVVSGGKRAWSWVRHRVFVPIPTWEKGWLMVTLFSERKSGFQNALTVSCERFDAVTVAEWLQ